jgi:hypothetical protein
VIPGFNAAYYLASNPDVAASGIDPYRHFLMFGRAEGRSPNPGATALDLQPYGQPQFAFNAAYYLANNPDVAAAGIDPFQHYVTFGWREGRNPSAIFDGTAYLQANPDVAAAGVCPLIQYESFGLAEGRAAAVVTDAETISIAANSGAVQVYDFRPGHDRIQVPALVNGLTVLNPGDLLSHLSATSTGTALDLGGGTVLTLAGVQPGQFSAANFSVG